MSATMKLAEKIVALRDAPLDPEAETVAKQCLLDWFGVALQGAQEPVADIMAAELAGANQGSHAIVGRREKAALVDATLINGTIGHALDYDDASSVSMAHSTVPVAPTVLTLAAEVNATGEQTLRAFLAGYEAQCAIGPYFGPDHYAKGYHPTGTIGVFGSAAAASLLLGLDVKQTAQALSLAATQSSGLKALFGSMGKPMHAGRAAADGLLAARLVARGFQAIEDGLENVQGAGPVLAEAEVGADLDVAAFGTHIRSTLFKFHAACYGTHAPIEAARAFLTKHKAEEVDAIEIHVGTMALGMCDIETPTSPLECKFSLHHAVAMVLAGIDTASLGNFSADMAADPTLAAWRDKISIIGGFEDDNGIMSAKLVIKTADETVAFYHHAGHPNEDLDDQQKRLEAKYDALAKPILGDAADRLKQAVNDIQHSPHMHEIIQLAVPA